MTDSQSNENFFSTMTSSQSDESSSHMIDSQSDSLIPRPSVRCVCLLYRGSGNETTNQVEPTSVGSFT